MACKRREYADDNGLVMSKLEGRRSQRDSRFGQVYLWARSGMCIPPPEGVETYYGCGLFKLD